MDAAPESSAAAECSDTPQVPYHDYSHIPEDATFDDIKHVNPSARQPRSESSPDDSSRKRGPSQTFVFPTKLYEILSKPEFSHIITWQPHGRSWRVVDRQAFTEQVMSKYFAQTKYPSFIRQVNGWGFKRITQGQDHDSYYNCFFLRSKEHLKKFMTRHPAVRNGSEPEPNLYDYPFLPPNQPNHIQDSATQPREYNRLHFGYAGHHYSLTSDDERAPSYDMRNDTPSNGLAAPATDDMTRNGSRSHSSYQSQMQGHSTYQRSYDNSIRNPTFQYNSHGRDHHSSFETGRQPSDFTSPSHAVFPSYADSFAAGNGYHHSNSGSLYNQAGGFHNEYAASFPNGASSDGHQVPHHHWSFSQQESRQTRTPEDSERNYSYHQDTWAASADTNVQNASYRTQNRETQSEHQYARQRNDEQLPAPPVRRPEENSPIEEHKSNARQDFSSHHNYFEPISRTESPPGDCWDNGLAATLSGQLQGGS